MTGEQSRQLKVGDRVCWAATMTDLGTVIGVTWSAVIIEWDDGLTASIEHNDMARVERASANLV
jgi:preprotein translocase subunit YajC